LIGGNHHGLQGKCISDLAAFLLIETIEKMQHNIFD